MLLQPDIPGSDSDSDNNDASLLEGAADTNTNATNNSVHITDTSQFGDNQFDQSQLSDLLGESQLSMGLDESQFGLDSSLNLSQLDATNMSTMSTISSAVDPSESLAQGADQQQEHRRRSDMEVTEDSDSNSVGDTPADDADVETSSENAANADEEGSGNTGSNPPPPAPASGNGVSDEPEAARDDAVTVDTSPSAPVASDGEQYLDIVEDDTGTNDTEAASDLDEDNGDQATELTELKLNVPPERPRSASTPVNVSDTVTTPDHEPEMEAEMVPVAPDATSGAELVPVASGDDGQTNAPDMLAIDEPVQKPGDIRPTAARAYGTFCRPFQPLSATFPIIMG